LVEKAAAKGKRLEKIVKLRKPTSAGQPRKLLHKHRDTRTHAVPRTARHAHPRPPPTPVERDREKKEAPSSGGASEAEAGKLQPIETNARNRQRKRRPRRQLPNAHR